MACELARHGIPFRIIDKKSERTPTSNAVWIQTRTLEILNDIGIANKFLNRGRICKAINLYTNNRLLSKIPFNYLDSIYHYVLILPQSETERILNAYLESLNFYVERPLELIEIKKVDNAIDTVVLNGNGQTEVISCDWLIACDGVNSTVRNICKIEFPGDDMQEQFMVADAQMSSYASTDEIHVFLEKKKLFAAFPFGQDKYRIGANLNLEHRREFFTEKEVKEMISERASSEFTAEAVSWISPFWIHSRIVDEMRHDCIFLVGDAGHVHSPTLGQGMNTGIQDAYNLAWKLALVIQGKAKTSLLDSYHAERYPVIKEIIERSDDFTQSAMSDSALRIRMRNFMLRLMHGISFFSNKTSMQIAQLDLRYTKSPVIDYSSEPRTALAQQGKRAPDLNVDASKRLHQYFHPTKHNVLIFTGKSPTSDELFALKEIRHSLDMMYSDSMHVLLVTQNPEEKLKYALYDKNAVIHKAYRVKKPSIFVMRPDNIIAYYAVSPSEYAVKHFFDTYLYS